MILDMLQKFVGAHPILTEEQKCLTIPHYEVTISMDKMFPIQLLFLLIVYSCSSFSKQHKTSLE